MNQCDGCDKTFSTTTNFTRHKITHRSLEACVCKRESNVKWNRMGVEENADFTHTETIVGVNNDCLERVFEFLEFGDLINVAEANKHLQIAAETVFARKLKRRSIIVAIVRLSVSPDISIYDDGICIRSLVLAVRTIRLFAQSISDLNLKFETNSPLRGKFFIHVNEYCHKTLNILQTFGDYSNIFGAAEHPFGNVEKYASYEGTVGPGWEHLSRLFPRLRQIILHENDILDSKYIIHQTFPNLDIFTVYNELHSPTNFNDGDLKTITTLNPQIQDFALIGIKNPYYFNPRIWELINTELKSLKSVYALFSPEHVERFKPITPILFNSVETFNVLIKIGSGPVNPIDVFSFKRLKNMTVQCYGDELEMWLDFVLAHPTIEELVIHLLNYIPLSFNLEYFGKVRQKLYKVYQNTKFISLRMNHTAFLGRGINELPKFLRAHQWFTKFSVIFEYENVFNAISDLEVFCENVPQIKNFRMKKNILTYGPHVDFEKCE